MCQVARSFVVEELREQPLIRGVMTAELISRLQ